MPCLIVFTRRVLDLKIIIQYIILKRFIQLMLINQFDEDEKDVLVT